MGLSTILLIVPLILLVALFYFLIIRPQRERQKKHQELMEQLRKGDKVLTTSGIYGQIESISEDTVILKIESGATMKVTRSSVAGKQGE
jgi:preprotein translocase subunit YajC